MNLAEEMIAKLEEAKEKMDMEVRIALIGQPGAGKSSLINCLVGKKLFEVGEHTDTTLDMSEAKFGDLKIVDLPGYGTQRFPFEEWSDRFHPEEYDLYLFVFDGKLHDSDSELFRCLKQWKAERSHPYFIVRNKEDEIWQDGKSIDELKEIIENDVRDKMEDRTSGVYFVSCRQKTGIDELKNAIFASDILEVKKDKLKAYFKARTIEDLDDKRQIALKKVDTYAYMGAANGLNPVPGVDVAIDLSVYFKMLKDIRDIFGIDDSLQEDLKKYEIFAPVGQRIFSYATKEGVTMLIKKLSKRFTVKEISKYIPIFGQVVAAAVGYKIMKYVGEGYVDDCYKLAEAILDGTLKRV